MNRIIYLEGSRAVGKSTLLQKIKKNHPEYVVIDGAARKEYMFDNTIFNEFIINEKLYLACAVAQYNVLKTLDTTIVLVKGPYTDVFYAKTFGEKQYGSERLNEELETYLNAAKACEPDMIVYLDAKKTTINDRCIKDKKKRLSMDIFMGEWFDSFEKYFKSFPQTVVIDTNSKEPEDVYNEFVKCLLYKAVV